MTDPVGEVFDGGWTARHMFLNGRTITMWDRCQHLCVYPTAVKREHWQVWTTTITACCRCLWGQGNTYRRGCIGGHRP